jgi:hypothetical protein
MDWFTVLLILIFFVFPLIQQILESKKGKSPPIESELEGEDEGWAGIEEPADDGRRMGGDTASSEKAGAWSTGWGAWPGDKDAESSPMDIGREPARAPPRETQPPVLQRGERPIPVPRENPPPVPQRAERPIPVPRENPPPVPQRAERAVPVPRKRAPEVARPSSRRTAASVSRALAAEEIGRSEPPRSARLTSTEERVTTPGSGLAERLRVPGELRRAILLNEILGKPVGMRHGEGDRHPAG